MKLDALNRNCITSNFRVIFLNSKFILCISLKVLKIINEA